MPTHWLIKNCLAMILIESAVHILSRVKHTHYLPNKQPELHTVLTFLSLRAGCVDPALAALMQHFFSLFLFSQWGKEGLLHGCLSQTVFMSGAETGRIFGGERGSCHFWYGCILTGSGSIAEVQRAPCWRSAVCCHKEITVWDYADLGTCLPSGSWSCWHWEAWKQRKGLEFINLLIIK